MDAKTVLNWLNSAAGQEFLPVGTEVRAYIESALSLAAASEGRDAIHSEDMDSTSREFLVMLCRILRRQRDSSMLALKAERERAGKMAQALAFYKDKNNWGPVADYADGYWYMSGQPWLKAHAALAAQEGRHD